MPTLAHNRFVARPSATLQPLVITTASLPGATAGSAYSTTFTSIGGQGPYTWSILSAVPNTAAWLSISSGGVLSGTPGTAETETVLVQVRDAIGTKASAFFSIVVTVSSGTPTFFQNFDSSTVGTSSALDNWGACTVDNTQSFSSPNSYKCHGVAGSGAFGASKVMASNTSRPAQGDEVWFRVRCFFPVGFNFTGTGGGGDAIKFLRIDTGPVGSNTHSHIDWYLRAANATNAGYFDFIVEGSAQNWMFGVAPTPVPTQIVRGQWYTIETYYKLNATGTSAIVRLWINGTLVVDTSANLPIGVTKMATLANATYVIDNATNVNSAGLMFITYWNVQLPATQDCWIDDFTVYCSNVNGPPSAHDAAGNAFIGMS